MLQDSNRRGQFAVYGALLLAALLAPMLGAYPVFVLKVLCFARRACSRVPSTC